MADSNDTLISRLRDQVATLQRACTAEVNRRRLAESQLVLLNRFLGASIYDPTNVIANADALRAIKESIAYAHGERADAQDVIDRIETIATMLDTLSVDIAEMGLQ